jgi:hypothetical protein
MAARIDIAMNQESPWKLVGGQASFVTDQWEGRMDLTKPSSGLSLAFANRPRLNSLLAVEFTTPNEPFLKDCFTRQGDLIVAYPQREHRNFSLQLDYRLVESSKAQLLLELWVSIQTYLLDTHPSVRIICPGSDSPATASNPIVASVGDSSIAWFVHPRDQSDTKLVVDKSKSRVQAQLFGHFMEKGVIRRARMRCLVSQSPLSQSVIDEAQAQFASSPLPLTA